MIYIQNFKWVNVHESQTVSRVLLVEDLNLYSVNHRVRIQINTPTIFTLMKSKERQPVQEQIYLSEKFTLLVSTPSLSPSGRFVTRTFWSPTVKGSKKFGQ